MATKTSVASAEFDRLYATHRLKIEAYVIAILPHKVATADVLLEVRNSLKKRFSEYVASEGFVTWSTRLARKQVFVTLRKLKQSR